MDNKIFVYNLFNFDLPEVEFEKDTIFYEN